MSRWDLNWVTDLPLIDDMHGGRQFQRLDAVRAKEDFRGIAAGLWCGIRFGMSHLVPLRGGTDELKGKGYFRVSGAILEVWDKSFFNFIYIEDFVPLMSPLDTMEVHGFQSLAIWEIAYALNIFG